MREKQRSEIIRMRQEGTAFSKISEITGISVNTVKSFCRRKGVKVCRNVVHSGGCMECGKPLLQADGRKRRKFCSDACRVKWWNSHPEAVNRRAVYHFRCARCGKEFSSYGNASRRFCSHRCYIDFRFKSGEEK